MSSKKESLVEEMILAIIATIGNAAINMGSLMENLMKAKPFKEELQKIDSKCSQYFNFVLYTKDKMIECVSCEPGIDIPRAERIKKFLPILRLNLLVRYMSINALPNEEGNRLCYLFDFITETYRNKIKAKEIKPGDSIPEMKVYEEERNFLCEQAEKLDPRISEIRSYMLGLYPYKNESFERFAPQLGYEPKSFAGQWVRWLCPVSVLRDVSIILWRELNFSIYNKDDEIIKGITYEEPDRDKFFDRKDPRAIEAEAAKNAASKLVDLIFGLFRPEGIDPQEASIKSIGEALLDRHPGSMLGRIEDAVGIDKVLDIYPGFMKEFLQTSERIEEGQEWLNGRVDWRDKLEKEHIADGLKYDYNVFNPFCIHGSIAWNSTKGVYKSILGLLLECQIKLCNETFEFRTKNCHQIENFDDYKTEMDYARRHGLLADDVKAEERCSKFLSKLPQELIIKNLSFCKALSELDSTIDIQIEKIGNVDWTVYASALKQNINAAKARLEELAEAEIEYTGWTFRVQNGRDEINIIEAEDFAKGGIDEEYLRQVRFAYYLKCTKKANDAAEAWENKIAKEGLTFNTLMVTSDEEDEEFEI